MDKINLVVGGMSKEQRSAFWSKVNIKNNTRECWEWQGAKKPRGYGNVKVNKQYFSAHRVSFILANGPIPEGYIVCHICDNPSCCNPTHMMLGTHKSNTADMLIKNRQKKKHTAARGEGNGKSKLSEENIRDIRKIYAAKIMNQYELAVKFGVTQPTIGHIVRNETWRHVP